MNKVFEIIVEKIMNKEKALSFSSLKAFLQSPKHFYEYCMDKKETNAMKEGTMFHMAVLEPDRFAQEYWVLEDEEKCLEIGGARPRSTKAYSEWLKEETSKHTGECVSKELYDRFVKMGEYLKVNSATKHIMANLTDKEKQIDFEKDGFKITGKIDGVGFLNGQKYTLDLKKVADASFNKLRWTIKDMKYDLQGAIYAHSETCSTHYIIAIDNSCNVTVVKFGAETLETSFNLLSFALDKFRECAEQDLFNSSYEFYNGGLMEY